MENNKELLIEKIKKILSLSNNPNENEAQNALLKAREMCAKYNIELDDISEENDKHEDAKQEVTDIVYTTNKTRWVPELLHVIVEKYRCKWCISRDFEHPRSRRVIFVGLPNDLRICRIVVDYAITFIKLEIARINEIYKKENFSIKEITDFGISYAFGFINGLEEQYRIQDEKNQEWGLVMQVPEVVNNIIKSLKESKPSKTKSINIDPVLYENGYNDGLNFKMNIIDSKKSKKSLNEGK